MVNPTVFDDDDADDAAAAVCVRFGGNGRGEFRAEAARAICGVESGVGCGANGMKATGEGVAVEEEPAPEVKLALAGETPRG